MPLAWNVLIASSALAQEQLPVVNSIEIKGLKRVEEGAVKSKITRRSVNRFPMRRSLRTLRVFLRWGILMM